MGSMHVHQGKEYSSEDLSAMAGITEKLFTKKVGDGWPIESIIAGITLTVPEAKRYAVGRKLTMFATSAGVCNAK